MTIKRLILEKVLELGEATLDAFFPRNYPEARFWRDLLGLGDDYEFSRGSFSRTLSVLNKDGLIMRFGSRKKASWKVTKKGRKYLDLVSKKRFSLQEDGKIRLVVFDVPEEDRTKRRWLRGRLTELNYTPIQRSVWIGKTILPKQFLADLIELGVSRCVHIFDVVDEYRDY